uniref:Uncharacterized protein n=1 Tax=Anguilla anguilla TaxID=7936 RepID=A0A0E9TFW0_ANGAN
MQGRAVLRVRHYICNVVLN